MNWKKKSLRGAQKRGSEFTKGYTQFNFKVQRKSPSRLLGFAPFPVLRSSSRATLKVLFYYWIKWGPLRPSQWGLKMALWTQNRQWRRRQEAAAPIKSILAKNSLRSQMAEKEEFTHFGQHNFWSLVSKICHRVSKQLRKWQ